MRLRSYRMNGKIWVMHTTPGIVIHGVTNGIAIIPLLLGILGVIE